MQPCEPPWPAWSGKFRRRASREPQAGESLYVCSVTQKRTLLLVPFPPLSVVWGPRLPNSRVPASRRLKGAGHAGQETANGTGRWGVGWGVLGLCRSPSATTSGGRKHAPSVVHVFSPYLCEETYKAAWTESCKSVAPGWVSLRPTHAPKASLRLAHPMEP